jgi:hypothetical protein
MQLLMLPLLLLVSLVARGEENFKSSCLGPLPIHGPIPKKERVVDFNPARAEHLFSHPPFICSSQPASSTPTS